LLSLSLFVPGQAVTKKNNYVQIFIFHRYCDANTRWIMCTVLQVLLMIRFEHILYGITVLCRCSQT